MSVYSIPRRKFLTLAAPALLVACGPKIPEITGPEAEFGFIPHEDYGRYTDGEFILPPVPLEFLQGVNRRMNVPYNGNQRKDNIEIDPHAKFLFYVMGDGTAWRYPIAVGRAGRSLRRPTTIRLKREWPGWTPTANMLRQEPEVYSDFAGGIPGGLASPLGSRALYLYQDGRDTFYRIHGTNDMGSIGNSGSAGCIRMFNHDIIDMFPFVKMGTNVRIRSYDESVRLEGEEIANRGVELPAKIVSAEDIYGATDTIDEAVAEAVAEEA